MVKLCKEMTTLVGNKRAIGAKGEELAARFLEDKGFEIVERNYRARRGEIDLIARDGETLVFVEVKLDRTGRFGQPEGWVDGKKQRQIAKTALRYLQENRLVDAGCRFDVVAISIGRAKTNISHIPDAFWVGDW